MDKNPGFTIKIFFPKGNPDGLKTVEKPNWTGLGVICPKALFPEEKKLDYFANPGVYVLTSSPSDSSASRIYIGEADKIVSRLEGHYRHKHFWTQGIFFVSMDKRLNKAHVKYLESKLIEIAKKINRCSLQNKEAPKPPNLSAPEIADMQNFLHEMLNIFPVLGINAFKEPERGVSIVGTLKLSSKGVIAMGEETGEGFTVYMGSQLVREDTPAIPEKVKIIRQELLTNGVIVDRESAYEFTQDFSFTSPSLASSVILARASSGLKNWRNEKGQTLGEIHEQIAGDDESPEGE
ncbi:MAG: GIY-YIG nuclease family protein [Candidatus Sumerlaeia bacterium]|nr:GIY-YIG nuclease family protein [Candidatus Sumerlaeia bacterium]